MKTAEEYRQQAEECRRLAELARSPEERATILHIAASWEELARYRERKKLRRGEHPARGTKE